MFAMMDELQILSTHFAVPSEGSAQPERSPAAFVQPRNPAMPKVLIEFFGMARRHAGCAALELEATTTGEVLRELAARCPQLEGTCLRDGLLAPGWLLNLEGQRFTRSMEEELEDGACVLLLSSDVGG